jgi:ketopantoate reductase
VQHWHVLGAGAIGGLFASLLQEAGTPCTLLLRDGDPDLAVGTTALTLRRGEQLRSFEFDVSASDDSGPISHLLVCTKAQDIVAAIAGVEIPICARHRSTADTDRKSLSTLKRRIASTATGPIRL